MKTKSKLSPTGILLMLLVVAFTTSCNKNNGENISTEQIRQALFDMKGSYHGAIEASFYQGAKIVKIDNVEAISRDLLTFMMPLEPIVSAIIDEKIVNILRNIEVVEVKAGYHFYQIDDNGGSVHFTLTPQNIMIPADGSMPDITIVFADSFGGNFDQYSSSMTFNISPKEILVNDVKLDSFKQLVYHFGGKYE